MKEQLKSGLKTALKTLGVDDAIFAIEYPEDTTHGDFSSNVAMVYAKGLKIASKVLAEKIISELKTQMQSGVLYFVSSAEVAGAGFINFKIKDAVFAQDVVAVAQGSGEYGWSTSEKNKHILVEHTDPNAFKAFHIGHLMANAIGESLSRLSMTGGSKVTKICYPSDIGLHIAKSVWAMKKHRAEIPSDDKTIIEKTSFLGKMYVEGTEMYDADPVVKTEIDALNKVIYEKSDKEVEELYQLGKKWSLEHYEILYKKLGTQFDDYIYESEVAPVGKQIVEDNLKNNIFEKSEGAVVFKGEGYGLHTRVFLNSAGLTTYEAKDLGLNTTKFKKYPDTDLSIIVTASEQNEYFKVIKKVLTLIDENIGSKMMHIGHGMLRFASGKMSSRTGKVITAEALIADIRELVTEKIADRELSADEKDTISDAVAIGAIKYSILRQAIGSDVIFDSAKSISFEGDSGPYLQYSAVRAGSILAKGKIQRSKEAKIKTPEEVTLLEKLISRFPDIIERARKEYSPQHVANYLINLAGAFNSYYATHTIIDEKDPLSPYRLALTKSFLTTMINGLWVLGIKVPERM